MSKFLFIDSKNETYEINFIKNNQIYIVNLSQDYYSGGTKFNFEIEYNLIKAALPEDVIQYIQKIINNKAFW